MSMRPTAAEKKRACEEQLDICKRRLQQCNDEEERERLKDTCAELYQDLENHVESIPSSTNSISTVMSSIPPSSIHRNFFVQTLHSTPHDPPITEKMRFTYQEAMDKYKSDGNIKRFFEAFETFWKKPNKVATEMQNLFYDWYAWWLIDWSSSGESWDDASNIIIADVLKHLVLTPDQKEFIKKEIKFWIDLKRDKGRQTPLPCLPDLDAMEEKFLLNIQAMANFKKDKSQFDRRRMIPMRVWYALGGGPPFELEDGSIPYKRMRDLGFWPTHMLTLQAYLDWEEEKERKESEKDPYGDLEKEIDQRFTKMIKRAKRKAEALDSGSEEPEEKKSKC